MDGLSATGAGCAAGVGTDGTDVVLVAVESHISGPGKAGRRLCKWKVSLSRCFREAFAPLSRIFIWISVIDMKFFATQTD